jgi:thiol-disulfide isomerase/thioredoxin
MSEFRDRGGRAWLLAVLALAMAFVAYRSVLRRGGADPARGKPADYGWRLVDLEGRPVDLGRYRGRAVFLNIWATWCPPCVGEMPSIARLAADPRLKGVAFVCVATDDDPEDVRRFVRARALPMTIVRPAGPAPPVFATDAIPATFLIAPDGRIARSEVGGMEWDSPEVISLLERLAKSAPGPS